jgi:hypothetical protein
VIKKNLLLVKSIISLLFLCLLVFGTLTVYAEPEIVIVSHTSYIDPADDLITIIGEIQNIGDQPATDVWVRETYYNADNEVIPHWAGSSVYLDVILPGRKSPFGDTDQITDVELIHNYSLNISFIIGESKPEKLKIISHNSSMDSYGFMHIVGVVENSGDLQEPAVMVIATCYNEAGEVVDVGSTRRATVNQRADFDIRLEGKHPDPIASYTLTAETVDYALIPEFNSYLLIISTISMVSIASLLYKQKIMQK